MIARADMDPFHAWSDPVTENSNNSTSGIGAGAGHGDTGSQLTEKNIPSHRTEGHSRTDSKDKNNKTRAHTNTQTNTSRSNTSHVHTNSQNPLQRTYVSKENTGSDRRYDGSNERTVNTASVTVSATGGCAVKNTGINESSETHSKGTRRHSRSNRKVAGDGYGVHEKSRYGRCKIPRTSPAKLTAQRVSSSVNDRHDHSAFASSFTSTSFSKGAHSSPIRPSSSSSAATAAAAATEPKTFHPRWAQLANKSKMDPSSSSMPSSQSSSSSSSSSSSMSTPIHPIRSVIMLPGQSHQQHYQHRINISSESSHTNEQNMDDGDTASRKTTQHRARLDALIIQFVYLFFQSSLSQLSTLILWLVAVTVGLCLQGTYCAYDCPLYVWWIPTSSPCGVYTSFTASTVIVVYVDIPFEWTNQSR